MRVASDPITVEQGCQWRKGCVKSEDGPIMIKREKASNLNMGMSYKSPL